MLDTCDESAKLSLSPPIRFRIEWACDQERVTASLPQAHFDLSHPGTCNACRLSSASALPFDFFGLEPQQPAQKRLRGLNGKRNKAVLIVPGNDPGFCFKRGEDLSFGLRDYEMGAHQPVRGQRFVDLFKQLFEADAFER